MLSMEGKGLQGERASPDLCRGGRNMLFRGGWGVGSRGPVISLLLPRYHPVLSGGQGSLYVNTSLPGSPGSGTGRRQRHEGTGFWGTNPRRNSSSRGTTCVQGGKNKNKKNLTLHMGKHPLMRKAHLHVGKKDFHISTHRRLVSHRRAKIAPGFQRPRSREENGLLCMGKTPIAMRNPMSTLALLHDV